MSTKTKTKEFSYDGVVEANAHRISFWFKGESSLTEGAGILEHRLDEEAESRSKAMTSEGYVCGELNIDTDDITAHGWWKIERD
jgi:hypothetical protein